MWIASATSAASDIDAWSCSGNPRCGRKRPIHARRLVARSPAEEYSPSATDMVRAAKAATAAPRLANHMRSTGFMAISSLGFWCGRCR